MLLNPRSTRVGTDGRPLTPGNLAFWRGMDRLSRVKPGSERSQLASEAMEIAVQEMEDSLGTSDFLLEPEALSLDGAMAFTLGPKPHG